MVVEEAVQAVLVGNAGVTALVPVSKIKVGFVGEGVPGSYISHGPVSVAPTHTYEALMRLRQWEFYSVKCFADSASAVRAMANAVRAALGHYSIGIRARWTGEGPGIYVDDVQKYQLVVEFSIAESL